MSTVVLRPSSVMAAPLRGRLWPPSMCRAALATMGRLAAPPASIGRGVWQRKDTGGSLPNRFIMPEYRRWVESACAVQDCPQSAIRRSARKRRCGRSRSRKSRSNQTLVRRVTEGHDTLGVCTGRLLGLHRLCPMNRIKARSKSANRLVSTIGQCVPAAPKKLSAWTHA